MQADTSFTSSFLEKLSMLVKSIDPDRLLVGPRASKKWRRSEPRVHTLLSMSPPAEASFPLSCADDVSATVILPDSNRHELPPTASPGDDPSPPQESRAAGKCLSLPPPPANPQHAFMIVPRLSLEVWRSELDERSEELDREIEELITYWERWPLMSDEDLSPKTDRISKWRKGHPWDLNDEYVLEDTDYDEERVEREALRDYLSQLEEPLASMALKEAGGQNRAAAALACKSNVKVEVLPERPASPFQASVKLPCGRVVTLKKPYVHLRRLSIACEEAQEESRRASGASSSSEEDEEDRPLRRGPRLKVHCRAAVMGGPDKKSQCTEADGSKRRRQEQSRRKRFTRQKALGGCQRPVAGQAGESLESSPASSPDGPSLKRYSFRQKSRTVKYDLGGENSWSDGDSEEDWSPVEDGSDVEEEEEEEEAEAEEEEDELVPNTPLKVNLPEGGHSYPCPDCGRKFSNSSNMWKHFRIHKGEKPFGCHACGKSFSDPSNLAKHQLFHTGERQHLCSLCPKAFYYRSNLETHLRHHKGIRPFSCLDCDSHFFSRASLLRHMEIHVFGMGGHRPQPLVRCKECDKTFAGTRLLRQHKKRHQRLVCETCGEVFNLKVKYMFHKSLHNTAPCEQCGASGAHLCQNRARDDQHPESGKRDRLAPPSDMAGSARQPSGSPQAIVQPSSSDSLLVPANTTFPSKERSRPSHPTCVKQTEQPSNSTQMLVRPVQPKTPLGLLSSALTDNKIAGPSTLAQATPQSKVPATQAPEIGSAKCPKRPLPLPSSQLLTQVKVRPHGLTQNPAQPRPPTGSKPLVLATCPVAGPEPTPIVGTLVPVVFPQPPPPTMVVGSQPSLRTKGHNMGQHIQHVPIAWPTSTVQPVAQPSANAPPWPSAPTMTRPFPQVPHAFPVSPATPVILFPLVASGPELMTISIPLNSPGSVTLLDNFNPVNMGPNKDLIVLNPATLPPGTKIMLQIPAQTVVPTTMPKTCQFCQTKYLGEHNCKMLHHSPVRRGQEKNSICSLEAEEKTTVVSQPVIPQEPSPALQPPPQARTEQEPLTKSYNLREARPHVTYVVEGEESDVGGDSDEDWQKEEVLSELSGSEEDDASPAASTKRQSVLSWKLREPGRAKQHRGSYMCNICDKKFVHQRSLKQHMRLHLAFSCDHCDASFLRSEQLKRHMFNHAKGATV